MERRHYEQFAKVLGDALGVIPIDDTTDILARVSNGLKRLNVEYKEKLFVQAVLRHRSEFVRSTDLSEIIPTDSPYNGTIVRKVKAANAATKPRSLPEGCTAY